MFQLLGEAGTHTHTHRVVLLLFLFLSSLFLFHFYYPPPVSILSRSDFEIFSVVDRQRWNPHPIYFSFEGLNYYDDMSSVMAYRINIQLGQSRRNTCNAITSRSVKDRQASYICCHKSPARSSLLPHRRGISYNCFFFSFSFLRCF